MAKLLIKYQDDQGQEQEVVLDNQNNENWISFIADYFVSIGLNPERPSEGFPVD